MAPDSDTRRVRWWLLGIVGAASLAGYIAVRGLWPRVNAEAVRRWDGLMTAVDDGRLLELATVPEQAEEAIVHWPDASPAFASAAAEALARRFFEFGERPVDRLAARRWLLRSDDDAWLAEVAVTTTSTGREALMRRLTRATKDADRLEAEARLAWSAGRKEAALVSLFGAHQRRPDRSATGRALGRLLAQMGALEAAEEVFARADGSLSARLHAVAVARMRGEAVPLPPPESIAPHHSDELGRWALLAAAIALEEGRRDEARQLLEQAKTAYSDVGDFQLAVADLTLLLGRPRAAARLFGQARALASPGALVGRARAWLWRRIERCISSPAEPGRVRFDAGWFALVRVDYRPYLFPEDLYRQVESVPPEERARAAEAASRVGLARLCAANGRLRRAEVYLHQARARWPAFSEASLAVRIALGRADWVEALDRADDIADSPTRDLLRARALIELDRSAEAEALLRPLLEKADLLVPSAYLLAAEVELGQERPQDASQLLERAERLLPNRTSAPRLPTAAEIQSGPAR